MLFSFKLYVLSMLYKRENLVPNGVERGDCFPVSHFQHSPILHLVSQVGDKNLKSCHRINL